MPIYEVNLHVDVEAAEEFAAWLRRHIDEMLEVEGFEKASWFDVSEEEGQVHWSVHYHVASSAALQRYFDGPAERMRREGLERFQGRFSADRRVLTVHQ